MGVLWQGASLLDYGVVKGDQDANEATGEDARRATVQGGVDPRDVFEIYQAPEGIVLLVDDEGEERLDDIERQGIEGVVEVRGMGAPYPRLAGQVEEIGREQGHDEAGEGPQGGRAPEGAGQKQEQVRDLNGDILLAVYLR